MAGSPALLLIFFRDTAWIPPRPSSNDPSAPEISLTRALSPTPSALTTPSYTSQTSGKSQHHLEFLLFSYLLGFVHREGRTGEFARAGLLFLFDVAFWTPSDDGGENLSVPDSRGGPDPLQDARDALGDFIVYGDFAEVMAAALGAVYSLLPSKLRVPLLADQAQKAEEGITASSSGGMQLGSYIDEGEDDPDGEDDRDLPSSADADIRTQLDLLLKLFGFLQDIIHRCNPPLKDPDADVTPPSSARLKGNAISSTTLNAMQSSFLDNILYPSILECSSTDGSAVAVMTYLDVVFGNLDDGPLLHRMITYLMGTEFPKDLTVVSVPPPGLRETAGSLGHRPNGVPPKAEYSVQEDRFTLKYLIVDNIRSSSPAASTMAIRLCRTLLSSHCKLASSGLLVSTRSPAAILPEHRPPNASGSGPGNMAFLPSAVNATETDLQEVELYGSLISRIDPLQTSSEINSGYAGYLTDLHAALQADPCYRAEYALQSLQEDEDEAHLAVGDSSTHQSRLSPLDDLVRTLLIAFGKFFCHAPDENVALTGVLTALALCPQRSLAGWLLYDHQIHNGPSSRRRGIAKPVNSSSSDTSEDEDTSNPKRNSSDPFSPPGLVDLPALYQILRDLVKQVHRFRLDVDDFERLLTERRQGLLFADHLDDEMNVMLDVEPTTFGFPATQRAPTVTPKRSRSSLVDSIKSYLTPRRKNASPSPGSPSAPTFVSVRDAAGKVSSSPFSTHYDQTSGIALEARPSSPIATGPWSSAKLPRPPSQARAPSSLDQTETDFTPGMGGQTRVKGESKENGTKSISLSVVLDNCVVLEEFLKEIVSIITARRALGIDPVGFV